MSRQGGTASLRRHARHHDPALIPPQQMPLREPVVAADDVSSDSECAIAGDRPGVPLPLTRKGK